MFPPSETNILTKIYSNRCREMGYEVKEIFLGDLKANFINNDSKHALKFLSDKGFYN